MRTAQLVRVTVVVLLGIGAMLGFVPGAPAGSALTPPRQTNCGDMAGPVWRVQAPGEQRGATGGHYSVIAMGMPCAKARSLTAKMIRRPMPATRFSTTILPGYTCLNYTTTAPRGMLYFMGDCRTLGTPANPMPSAIGFIWHHCEFVLGSGAHPTCKWHYYKVS